MPAPLHRAPANLKNSLQRGMQILERYDILECEGAVVPDSYPNGTAKHSHACYLSVMVHRDALEPDAIELRELGWFEEQDGQYWLLMLS